MTTDPGTIATLQADIASVVADVSTGLSGVAAALQTGTQTTADVRRAAAVLTGAAATIRDVRTTLDALAPADVQRWDDGAVTLALWQWERAVRWSLTTMDGRLRKGIDTADEIIKGRAETRYAVRLGDTLQSIAAAQLGAWTEWTRLVDANGLNPADTLAPGTVLTIPRRV